MSSLIPLSTPSADVSCPCGSGQTFGLCCGPILARERSPATAEQLMRARFSAHVAKNYLFLHQTYLPSSKLPYVEEAEGEATQWTRLKVHSHESGAAPDLAFVEFSAYFVQGDGSEQALEEKAEFRRIQGEWFYTRAVRQGPAPFKAAREKVGRNDPCPCGSGKKYKHCCLV